MTEHRHEYHQAEMEIVAVDTNDIICTSNLEVEKTITTPAGSGFEDDLGNRGEL